MKGENESPSDYTTPKRKKKLIFMKLVLKSTLIFSQTEPYSQKISVSITFKNASVVNFNLIFKMLFISSI